MKNQRISSAPEVSATKHVRRGTDMFITPDSARSHKTPVEVGPAPYHHRSDCFICRIQDGLEVQPAGSFIIEGRHFVVVHAPLKKARAGTVIVLSRRHLLDYGEMTPAESDELGSILRRLVPAVKEVTGAPRVYFLAFMEHSPHFHLWLIPRKKGGRVRGLAYLEPPTVPTTQSAAEAISKKISTRFEELL